MASAVIGLIPGRPVMTTSGLLSRIADASWWCQSGRRRSCRLVRLAEIVGTQHHDLSVAMLYCRRIILSTRSMLPGPADHAEPTADQPVDFLDGLFRFGRGLALLAGLGVRRRALGTTNTTTFLRRIATAWPSFGMSTSRRTTARSALVLVDGGGCRWAGPSSDAEREGGCWRGARASCGAIAWTTGASSLLGRADRDAQTFPAARGSNRQAPPIAPGQQQERDTDQPGVPHHDRTRRCQPSGALRGALFALSGPAGGFGNPEQAAYRPLGRDDTMHTGKPAL